MVVMNTIKSCREVYQYLKTVLEAEREEYTITSEGAWESEHEILFYLSTHVIPKHRLERIEKIKTSSTKRKIIITTQLIEAGVDISIDKIYRDFAPLDSIIQTAGRCNRHNEKEKGEVVIIVLEDKERNKFHSYIYDSVLTSITNELLKDLFFLDSSKVLDEQAFTLKAINEYFLKVKERGSEQPSREFLEKVERLLFNKLRDFQLIKNQVTLPIFVEIDDKSRKIREAFEEELEQVQRFEKKIVRRKYQKKVNDYIINIRADKKVLNNIKALPNIAESEYMFYIPYESKESWYRIDVGFSLEEDSHQEMRFL